MCDVKLVALSVYHTYM